MHLSAAIFGMHIQIPENTASIGIQSSARRGKLEASPPSSICHVNSPILMKLAISMIKGSASIQGCLTGGRQGNPFHFIASKDQATHAETHIIESVAPIRLFSYPVKTADPPSRTAPERPFRAILAVYGEC